MVCPQQQDVQDAFRKRREKSAWIKICDMQKPRGNAATWWFDDKTLFDQALPSHSTMASVELSSD
jgi:hypothetical protein